MRITDLKSTILHVIAATPNFILANQCMYDWFDDDYLKGGRLPFDGPCLKVPEGPGLGVELDPDKVRRYHEHYREVGEYSIFGMDDEALAAAPPPPLFPSY